MDKWKIAFWILFMIFVLESIYLLLVLSSFTSYREMIQEVQEERIECASEICADYGAFVYEPIDYLCSCYNDGELAYEEVLRL